MFSWGVCLTLHVNAFSQSLFPFTPIAPETEESRDAPPEDVPTGLIEPRIVPRQTAADKLARYFSKELRELEAAQSEVQKRWNELPESAIESFLPHSFGYLSGNSLSRPKWIQIDLGETVSPDAYALFPVTVQVMGQTIFGYGFPRTFQINISNDPEFRTYETVFEGKVEGSRRWPFFIEKGGQEGRYVRVVANTLWRSASDPENEAFALSEVMVFKGERNLAIGQQVKFRDRTERGAQWATRFVNDGVTAFGLPHGQEDSPSIGYQAKTKASVKSCWVQVDLEEAVPIQEVRIILADTIDQVPDPRVNFPYSITLEASEYPDLRNAEILGKISTQDINKIGYNNPLVFPVKDGYGRYVRLTVSQNTPAPIVFTLAELQIFSENRNVALGKSVLSSHAAVTGNGFAPEFLVDGFSSRKSLISYQAWVSSLDQRFGLVRKWLTLEEKRAALVDQTFTRGVITSATGLLGGLALAFVIYAQGRVKRRKELEALRQRIASDLHDDIGSNLSSIALLAELGKAEACDPKAVTAELKDIKVTADKTIESMRDIVWLIRPGEETWRQMMTRFRETASKLLRRHDYSFTEKGQMSDDRLPLEFKRDFFLIYKEILNNIVRHAEANTVEIEVATHRSRLELSIKDNGKGFDNLDEGFREGNGLRNLRMRAQSLGAKLVVKSKLSEGTTVTLTARIP